MKLNIYLELINDGIQIVQLLTQNRFYSMFFMRRRITNQRGSPMRAALYWSILEEARISVEGHLNRDKRTEARPLRDALNTFLCKFSENSNLLG